ncbi:cell death-inducing p53-target protein 1 homolog [Actinia tenebrosa]|uniref:Cell death-inducing p53-target protein 1 homolog n=1 Tax=Actinia tenebrosa TaxID=6105 RepID=A0A6P8HUX7_ACTTE|nr:cell death-inducing p53-target protein 1 homolog [Actinia tenebrosa]
MSQAPPPYPGDPQKNPYPPQQPGYPPQQAGYPPQQPGYPQQGYPPSQPYPAHHQQSHNTTTIIQTQPTTTVITPAFFGETPVAMMCPHCQASIVTATEYVPGSLAWIICVVLFFVFWPCCWLPFVIDGCKDVLHSCPNCRRQVGSYSRM